MNPTPSCRLVRRMLPALSALMAILTFWCACPGRVAAAEDDSFSRQTLRGLKGFYLMVEDVDPDLIKGGLNRERIVQEVEKRLRRSPIQVLTLKESFQEVGRPYLEIAVLLAKPSTGPYGYFIEVSLNQEVRPTRPIPAGGYGGSGALHAQTWRIREAGTVDRDKVQSLAGNIGEIVDQFLVAHASANKDVRDLTTQ